MDVVERTCADDLFDLTVAYCNSVTVNQTSAYDVILVISSIIADLCFYEAGECDPNDKDIKPGQPILSQEVNRILTNDYLTYEEMGTECVFGLIFNLLNGNDFSHDDFPSPENFLKTFLDGIGDSKVPWGMVSVSVQLDSHPNVLPLRVAFETREYIEKLMVDYGIDRSSCLVEACIACANILAMSKNEIPALDASTIAFEVINGMSKTAPMTSEKFNKVTNQ